jgi:capsule polysaccharide export protein KpsE/RkpR
MGSELARVSDAVEGEFVEARPAAAPAGGGELGRLYAQLERARLLYVDNDPAVTEARGRLNAAEQELSAARKRRATKANREAAEHAARMASLRASTALEEAREAAGKRFDEAMESV